MKYNTVLTELLFSIKDYMYFFTFNKCYQRQYCEGTDASDSICESFLYKKQMIASCKNVKCSLWYLIAQSTVQKNAVKRETITIVTVERICFLLDFIKNP